MFEGLYGIYRVVLVNIYTDHFIGKLPESFNSNLGYHTTIFKLYQKNNYWHNLCEPVLTLASPD